METVQEKTYENIYYLLWEAAQRYQKFTQFRVIGKSHDDRMIPMLEIGTGDLCIFCIAGFSGTDGQMSDRLAETAVELCRNYECGWTVQEFYEVRKLLDQCDSFADGKKSAHEQRFSVVRRTGSLIGGMTG